MNKRLKMKRDGACAWLLYDPTTDAIVGGIEYEHASHGDHYRPWVLVDGVRSNLDKPLPQLAMAARAIEASRP